MDMDLARRQLAHMREVTSSFSMWDDTHPLHPINEPSFLAIFALIVPARDLMLNSGMDVERMWPLLEATFFSTKLPSA